VTHDWAGIVEREGTVLAAAAAADLTASVPAAPGWDAAELLRHLGLIYARVGVVLRTGTMERPSIENGMLTPAPADRAVVVDWFGACLADVVAAMRGIDDPDRPVYSFAPGHRRAGFWPRRQAHETTVHRVDAEQAAVRPRGAIDPTLAVDGVDEILDVFLPFSAAQSPADGRTVHLHATDADGEWLVRFDAGAVAVERGHAKGDAAVRGPAAALYLWLWGRLPIEQLELFGDPEAAATLRTLAAR